MASTDVMTSNPNSPISTQSQKSNDDCSSTYSLRLSRKYEEYQYSNSRDPKRLCRHGAGLHNIYDSLDEKNLISEGNCGDVGQTEMGAQRKSSEKETGNSSTDLFCKDSNGISSTNTSLSQPVPSLGNSSDSTMDVSKSKTDVVEWPKDVYDLLVELQEQLILQRAQLAELQKKVIDLAKQVSTNQIDNDGVPSSFNVLYKQPFRNRCSVRSEVSPPSHSSIYALTSDRKAEFRFPTTNNDASSSSQLQSALTTAAEFNLLKNRSNPLKQESKSTSELFKQITMMLVSPSSAQAPITAVSRPTEAIANHSSPSLSISQTPLYQHKTPSTLVTQFSPNRTLPVPSALAAPKEPPFNHLKNSTSIGSSNTTSNPFEAPTKLQLKSELSPPLSSRDTASTESIGDSHEARATFTLPPPLPTSIRNTTGLPSGVWYDRVENRYVVQCNETTNCGRKKRRYFSVSRYGEENAKNLAIAARLEIMGLVLGDTRQTQVALSPLQPSAKEEALTHTSQNRQTARELSDPLLTSVESLLPSVLSAPAIAKNNHIVTELPVKDALPQPSLHNRDLNNKRATETKGSGNSPSREDPNALLFDVLVTLLGNQRYH